MAATRWGTQLAIVGLVMAATGGVLLQGRMPSITAAAIESYAPVEETGMRQCVEPIFSVDTNPLVFGTNRLLFPVGLQIQKDGPSKIQRGYVGFQDCLRCHNAGIQGAILGPGGVKIKVDQEQWVTYREFPIWSREDKHGQAYAVLLNQRSKEMAKILRVPAVHRDLRCLACHTGYPLSLMPTDKSSNLVDEGLAKKLDINLGVSCEGCHGPAGNSQSASGEEVKGWMTPHQTSPSIPYDKTKPWRFLAPKTKANEYGFVDVRSPSSKTKLCVSCHIGDVEQGRIVTHEMYAAGHPPLPGFEIESFTNQMPRHWKEFTKKSAEVQDNFFTNTQDPLYDPKTFKKTDLHHTHSLLVAALIMSGEYLRYTSQLADAKVASPVKRGEWPELALFDCYACHHDLKNPAWRQVRTPPTGTPGRPALQAWPFVLSKIAIQTLGVPKSDFDAALTDLRQATGSRPFGSPTDVGAKAQTASAWFHAKGLDLEKKQIGQEQGVAILRDIAALAASEIVDYDSARQLVWAFTVVDRELNGKYPNHAKIKTILAELTKESILLDLRKHRNTEVAVPGDEAKRLTEAVDLEAVLPFVGSYNPLQFQEKMKEIGGLLK